MAVIASNTWLVLSVLRQNIDLQIIRNIIIPPLFFMLGLATQAESWINLLTRLHFAIVIIAIFEAFFTSAYTSLFNVASYYISTRGNTAEDFYNTESDLFVSATRPDARFLISSLEIPRLSSVFLEPVSLGNYIVISLVAFLAFKDRVSRATFWCAIIGSVALLIGTDSRFASVASVAVLAIALVWHQLPSRYAWTVLPLVLLSVFAWAAAAGLQAGRDNFEGRLANTVQILTSFEVADLFGVLSGRTLGAVYDSGIAYLIVTESAPIVVLCWVYFFSRPAFTREAKIISFGLATYFSLSMIVSYSITSIKTASLAWFLLGYVARRPSRTPQPVSADKQVG